MISRPFLSLVVLVLLLLFPTGGASASELPGEAFASRREALMASLEDNALAVIWTAPQQIRNGDVHHPYRPDSNFYYLTGFAEPQALAILEKRKSRLTYTLVVRPKDPLDAVWNGPRSGLEGAERRYGADQARAWDERQQVLRAMLADHRHVYWWGGSHPEAARLRDELIPSRTGTAQSLATQLASLRLVKSEAEIRLLRRAADITGDAHRQVMRRCQPGLQEYQLQAVIDYVYRDSGVARPGFPSTLGSGPNSCILHYQGDRRTIDNGDLVLVDIGAEWDHYSADITRTFPANGTFSTDQKALYKVVLRAQEKAIEQIRPGVTVTTIRGIVQQEIAEGLKTLKILSSRRRLSDFTVHGFHHWLGLDVHDDCGPIYSVALQPGMVLTVEPGVYIPAGMEGVDPRWWNLGIRIEDDVLVTRTGSEILSGRAPKSIEGIEALMAEEDPFASLRIR